MNGNPDYTISAQDIRYVYIAIVSIRKHLFSIWFLVFVLAIDAY